MRWTILCVVLCAACGGATGTIPTTPSPTPTTWTLTGRVVGTMGGQAIVGAHLSPYNVTTGADGSFTASGSGSRTTDRVTIDAAGFVSRQTTIASSATAPTLDLFPSSALDFYRQMVRNGFEAPTALEPVRRWTAAPSFYIDQTGLSAEDVRRITVGIQIAVTQLSSFSVPSITTGPPRSDQPGSVTIATVNLSTLPNCGTSLIGSNPGHIDLNVKTNCAAFCPGGKVITGIVAHEVGHALGFWHTSSGLMLAAANPAINYCSDGVGFTPAERQAAAIAYQRPNGNLDPDVDPN